MKISMIAAMSENRVIGKGNDLVWHLPADFKFFKDTTKGHPIIMGRKTFESLGKPLPFRTNIVISNSLSEVPDGTVLVRSLEEAVSKANGLNTDETFIIGGASIYRESLEVAKRIYLTLVHHEFDGDAFFPELSSDWLLADSRFREKDEKNPYDMTFKVFEKED